jgi:hypothetical protein
MSVDCRIVVGLTIDLFDKELSFEDFDRIHKFIEEHPELDEYDYRYDEREGKPLLISDGMNGDFARLVWVDKIIEPGMLGESNEYIKLSMPAGIGDQYFITQHICELIRYWEEFTGKEYDFNNSIVDYAMWSQWS